MAEQKSQHSEYSIESDTLSERFKNLGIEQEIEDIKISAAKDVAKLIRSSTSGNEVNRLIFKFGKIIKIKQVEDLSQDQELVHLKKIRRIHHQHLAITSKKSVL